MTQPVRRGGRGFKIADGFVEVHGIHDRATTRRAAQEAGDESGSWFSRALFRRLAGEVGMARQVLSMLFPATLFLMLPALVALVATVGQLAAALVALGGSLGFALTGLTAIIPAVFSLIGAFAVLKIGITAAAETPAWKRLKSNFEEISENIKKEFLPGITDLINAMNDRLPLVNAHLTRMARILGRSMSMIAELVRTDLFGERLQNTFREVERATRAWSEALAPALSILVSLAEASAPLFTRFSLWARDMLRSFDAFLLAKRESGELAKFFAAAGEELAKWGRIIGNLIGGLAGIFIAAAGPGRELASSIDEVMRSFREWSFSEEGARQVRTIVEFFLNIDLGKILATAAAIATVGVAIKTLSGITGIVQGILLLLTLGPVGLVIVGVASALAILAGAFVYAWTQSQGFRDAIRDLVQVIGDRLVPILRDHILPPLMEIGEALGGTVMRGFRIMASFIGDHLLPTLLAWWEFLGTSVIPILLEIGKVIVDDVVWAFGKFWDIIETFILPVLAVLMTVFREHVLPVLTSIANFIKDEVIPRWADFRQGIRDVADAIQDRLLVPLQTAVAWMKENLLPVLREQATELREKLGVAVEKLSDLWENRLQPAVERLVELWQTRLQPALQELWEKIDGPVLEALKMLGIIIGGAVFLAIVTFVNGLITAIEIFTAVVEAIDNVIGFFRRLRSNVVNAISAIVEWFQELPGKVVGFLQELPGRVSEVFNEMSDRVLYRVGFMIGRVLRFFKELPGNVSEFLRSLPGRVRDVFNRTMDRARSIVNNGIDRVVTFFRRLPGRARDAVSSLWGRIRGAFRSAVSNARTAASNLVSGFINRLRNLPGRARDVAIRTKNRIRNAFSGAINWLKSAGGDIIRGLANGIRGAIGSAVDAALDAARSVVDGVKDGLGIGSPSKVMRDQIGRWIPAGIAEGIRRNEREPQDAVKAMLRGIRTGGVSADGVNIGGDGAELGGRGGGGVVYHFEPGSITLDASKIRSIKDLVDMVDSIKVTSRKFGAETRPTSS